MFQSSLTTALRPLGVMAVLLFNSLLGCNQVLAHEGEDHPIVLTLEAPDASTAVSGIANLRGWAVAKAGIQEITLMVDGTVISNIPFGGIRQDVASLYPTYPDSSTAGFSMAFNYALLTPGNHQIVVTAFDKNGLTEAATVNFTVIGFHKSFFPANTVVDLGQATITGSGQTISIQGMSIDGVRYNVTLAWHTESQTFQFTDIVLAQ